MSAEVRLRSERNGRDSRSLWLRLDDDGNLTIEGQDLGPSVEEFWGGSEYEWTITIQAASMAAYIQCLGGNAGQDVLGAVSAAFERDPRCVGTEFLKMNGIPYDFWSRVGD